MLLLFGFLEPEISDQGNSLSVSPHSLPASFSVLYVFELRISIGFG